MANSSSDGREALQGAEEDIFDLISELLAPKEWAEWLKAPLARAAAKGNRSLARKLLAAGLPVVWAGLSVVCIGLTAAVHKDERASGGTPEQHGNCRMDNRDGREALRGAEKETFDLVSEILTSEEWAEWLKAPLERAAAQCNRCLARRLVGAGAKIGDALHAAVRGGHGEIVDDLLENGASVAAVDVSGAERTPLHVAAREGNAEMVQLLLLRGADRNALDNADWTPLYTAAYFGHVAAVQSLLAGGADAHLRYTPCNTPVVHVAAQEDHTEVLRVVIEHGVDVDARDRDQSTALHFAAAMNRVGAIDLLVQAGANIGATTVYGETPLHCAARQVRVQASLALVNHGADVNAKNLGFKTPLHYASAKAGKPYRRPAEVVDILLRSGADETMVDDRGHRAVDLIGNDVEEEDSLAGDADRVEGLLRNAPWDRAWRRRGYLVLCRAHPDRVQRLRQMTGRAHAAMSKVLGLQEEGVFRAIVGYL